MNNNDIIYRKALLEDIGKITEINIESVPNGIRSLLGEKLVAKMFQMYYEEAPLFIVAEEKKEVIGYVMGCVTYSKVKNKYNKKYFFWINARLFIKAIKGNRLAQKCLKNNIKKLIVQKRETVGEIEVLGEVELHSICIRKEYRNKGIASFLINEFENMLYLNGYKDYYLFTDKENKIAQHVYEKAGLKFVKKEENSFWYHKKIIS